METCVRCRKEKTGKRIDGVPVCQTCMLKDAAENKGRVIDYSLMAKQPEPAGQDSRAKTPRAKKTKKAMTS